MRRRAHPCGTGIHPRRETGHLKPERLQDRGKEHVLLMTIAPAPRGDELVLETGDIQPDRAPQQDIEVLKGDGHYVGEVEPMQGLGSWLSASGIADALKVSDDIDRAVLPAIARRVRAHTDPPLWLSRIASSCPLSP
ncbi:hypothetical protein NITHO_4040009 [Nitrolancea hollandica Lb]|uniref:Uncharacterized protein n=1 Tax=Nitrolancea hollandica Lb TaxID=1129897 RepID=I4EJI1_9BACT|nr:hypothetical protein NITHO_4040009 [Nitrolancea hollandica Lb]